MVYGIWYTEFLRNMLYIPHETVANGRIYVGFIPICLNKYECTYEHIYLISGFNPNSTSFLLCSHRYGPLQFMNLRISRYG